MVSLVSKWFEFFARRPVHLWGGVVAIVALAALGAVQLRFSEDVLALLPSGNPMVAEGRLALDRFESLERIIVGLEGENADTLASDIDEAETRLLALQGVTQVIARVSEQARDEIAANYLGKAPLLFDAAMQQDVEARLNATEFGARLQQYLDRQAGSEGITAADTFRSDPFGLDGLVLRRFERLNSGFAGRLHGGRLFSADGRMAVLMVEVDYPAGDTSRGRDFMPTLKAALDQLPGQSRVHVIGAHRSSVDNAIVLRSDLNWTIAASAIAVAMLFFVAFRSLIPVLLALISAGFGFAIALGFQGAGRGDLSAISAGFAGVLMAISLDCVIHLVSAFSGLEGERESRARQALRHVAVPSSLAVMTTIVAVATLRLSSFDGLHQLCEMGIAGMAGALLFSLVAGPQVLRRWGPAPRPATVLSRALSATEAVRRKARWPLLALFTLVTISLAACLPMVHFDGDVMNLDGKSPATRNSEQRVQQAFGDSVLRRTLLVSGGDGLQAALRQNDLTSASLHALGATYDGLGHVLPARQTQAENLARWRGFFSEQKIARIMAEMAQARAKRADGAEVSFSEAAVEARFGAFFDSLRLAAEPAPLDAEAFQGSAIWGLFANYVHAREGRVEIGTTAQLEASRLGELRARVPSVLILNKAGFVSQMITLIQRDLGVMGGLSMVMVVALVWLNFRRVRQSLIALAPVMLSLVWTLGLMGLLGIKFNIINTLVTVFIAGLGIDYGVFFVQTWRESAGSPEAASRLRIAGTGVLLAALVNLAGFGTLALADHPALFSVGVTTVLGILSSLVLTVLLVPTLLELSERR